MWLHTGREPAAVREEGPMSERKVGSVTYREVGEDYFKERGLRRHAGMWSLWGLGVGAVISGEYYGWNFGLGTGGFGGLLIAGVIMAIMYYGLVYSIAEMSPALPHTGGAYSFARSAMGPWGGFLTGLAENAEYVITPAVVAGAMALLMQTIVTGLFDVGGTFDAEGTLTNIAWWNSLPVWMAVFYIIFVWINYVGIEATMRFTVTITVLSIGVLAFFFLATIFSGKFDTSFWTNIPKDWDGESALLAGGGGPWLPFGIEGIFKSLPFAIWFFLAIEEVPLAAEESMDPRRDVPRGSVLAMHTLLIAAVLTLFLNTGLPDGAGFYGSSAFPLLDGFTAIFGTGKVTYLLGLLFMIGLIASFFTIIFAYGRNTYSLSRAGYFPQFLSKTHGSRKTPHVALIAGALVGYAVAVLVYVLQQQELGAKIVAALLNMAVFAAVISYVLQMTSFVVLRKKLPNIERPYRSRFGIPGAVVAGALAATALVAIFLNDAYRPGVYGVAIYYVLGVLYFAIAGRNRLVLSPEEEFALTQGEAGIPAQEGFVATTAEQERILGSAPSTTPAEPTTPAPPTEPPSSG
jgi:ethanolamine permease